MLLWNLQCLAVGWWGLLHSRYELCCLIMYVCSLLVSLFWEQNWINVTILIFIYGAGSVTKLSHTIHTIKKETQNSQLQLHPHQAGETDDVCVEDDVVAELHSAAPPDTIAFAFATVLANPCAVVLTTGAYIPFLVAALTASPVDVVAYSAAGTHMPPTTRNCGVWEVSSWCIVVLGRLVCRRYFWTIFSFHN